MLFGSDIPNLRVQKSMEYALDVHQKILDLFIKKDVKGVEALVKEHISTALSMFLCFLESNGEK
jgi:DNA-binding GntR family transcriptional regulator